MPQSHLAFSTLPVADELVVREAGDKVILTDQDGEERALDWVSAYKLLSGLRDVFSPQKLH